MLNNLPSVWRLLTLLCLLQAGCNWTRAGIEPPRLEPEASTDRAFTLYDANADQKLSRNELADCPGLLSAIGRFDQDGDSTIAADELTSSLERFEQEGAGLVAISCVVMRNSQPLGNAKVELVPEVFLGDAIKPASGISAADGSVTLSVAEEAIPVEYRGRIKGVPTGVFRVIVTHPSIAIPAKYNSKTELGRLVSRRDHETLTIDL